MLDLSDGLAIDAARLAKASGVAIDFEPALLGPTPSLALAGGEDHSLLAAFPPSVVLPPSFRRIGRIVDGDGVTLDGQPWDPTGWDPYRRWSGEAG